MRKLTAILLIFFIKNISSDANGSDDFTIDTKIDMPQGKIKGSLNLSGTRRRFLGIPFASVPGRFQEPGSAPSWNGTLDATQHSPGCKQYFTLFNKFNSSIGTEDCLSLNVYSPISAITKKLPVMVFIHGGGFVWGSNTDFIYDPKFIVEKNNVVVTINYRLGALGFLCLKNKGAPGNVGLKDQVAALKWIKKNIKYFGGNPDLITLFGDDVGAASVNYLLVTPATSGLFHGAILQSGTMLMDQAFDENPIESASAIAARSGFHSTDPEKLLQFYNDLPIDELIKTTSLSPENAPFAPYVFRPCIEASNEGALITAHPRDLLKSAKLNSDVKVIIGYNEKEGILWASRFNYTDLPKVISQLLENIPDYLEFSQDEDKMAFVEEVKQMYINDETVQSDVANGLVDYFSDGYIMYPSVATTEYLLNNSDVTVYNYEFAYVSIRNYARILESSFYYSNGAGHYDELFYLFDPITPLDFYLLPFPYPRVLPEDALLIYKMTMMWSYFALNGNPSIPESSRLPFPIQWKESKPNNLEFLRIDRDLNMEPLPNKKRIDFWKNAYQKYGKYRN